MALSHPLIYGEAKAKLKDATTFQQKEPLSKQVRHALLARILQ